MTNEQKVRIQKLRTNGLTYLAIGSKLGLSENTVKSYLRRNSAIITAPIEDPLKGIVCKFCGKDLVQLSKRKPKIFCSDECRFAWWSKNKDSMNKEAYYKVICENCNKEFESYGYKERKYCSHACYINNRFMKGAGSDIPGTV